MRDTRGILASLQPEVLPLLAESCGGGVVASDVYLTNPAGEDVLVSQLGGVPADKEVSICTRSRYVADAYAAADASIDRGYATSLVLVGLLIYFVWTVREQFVRFERRRKSIAILHSLGLPLTSVTNIYW